MEELIVKALIEAFKIDGKEVVSWVVRGKTAPTES